MMQHTTDTKQLLKEVIAHREDSAMEGYLETDRVTGDPDHMYPPLRIRVYGSP
jgi:hypothetical protein